MKYTVEVKKKEFKVLNSETKEVLIIGKYNYTGKVRCELTINNVVYKISPKSAWENILAIHNESNEVGEIEIGWSGNYTLRIQNKELMTKYFKLTIDYGWSTTKLLLNDFLTNHLLTMKIAYDWKTFKPLIALDIEEGYKDEENKVDELLLIGSTMYTGIVMMMAATE